MFAFLSRPYIRSRNGYAQFQLGKYRKAQREFEKAMKFNSSEPFAAKYSYWSALYAENRSEALLKTIGTDWSKEDSALIEGPKPVSEIYVLGGYRVSTSAGQVGNMPYASVFIGHEIGKRISLYQGMSYLSQNRAAYSDANTTTHVWQVGYLASLGIQAAQHTRIVASFIMQYWETPNFKVFDLGASLAAKQHLGNFDLTVLGGYMEDTDTAKYTVGATLAWYPLSNVNLYSLTSFSYLFGKVKNDPAVKQTVGGRLFKRFWLSSSITVGNRMMDFEDEAVGFSNTSLDRLRWLWSISPTYYPTDKLSVQLTYSAESRRFWRPATSILPEISSKYNFHSFYLGLGYKF